MSENANVYAAFISAQKGFAPALKTSTNPHFKSKYVDLASCVEAVIDSLHANDISMIQKTHDCESGVKVETVFIHKSGESISGGLLHVPAAKNDPQGYGSALTYARRYSLMAACGIAPEDDDGNAAADAKNRQDAEKAKKEAEQWAHQKADLEALLNAADTMDSLQSAWALAYKQCAARGDKTGADALEKVKNTMKGKLTQAEVKND